MRANNQESEMVLDILLDILHMRLSTAKEIREQTKNNIDTNVFRRLVYYTGQIEAYEGLIDQFTNLKRSKK